MVTHSKMSQHNGIDHQADFSSSDPDQPGPDLLGLTDGASGFVPPGALLWSSGGSALALHMSELSAGVVADVSTPGSGLVFDNTYLAGCTTAFETCIVAAEQQLESLFSNSDTIIVTFNESSFGPGSPNAMANSYFGNTYSYATVETALQKAAPGDVLPSTDPSGGGNWFVPLAYARMLGLTTTVGSPDLSVSLNTDDSWSFGQDVINGLTHELSEGGMGRIGSLGPKGAGSSWSTMDLFRYNAAGQADYSNGRDGDTTYFSADGGVTLSDQNLPNGGDPTLSYNNQYSSTGSQVNGGDTADWAQQNVFGATGGGETLALTQTELEVMQALGWHLTLKQDVYSGAGSWETPTGWSTGSMPIEPQDVYLSGGGVTLDSDVLVNSICTSGGSVLSIGDTAPTTLIAVDGTGLNPEDVSAVASGNFGTIAVYINSMLQIGSTNEQFYNPGSVVLGKGAGGFGSADLAIAGLVSLTGGGQIDMGGAGIEALILDAPGTSSDSLVNVNNTISGGGLILIDNFENEAGGSVVATSQEYLQIVVGSFLNQGTILAESNGTIDFGEDGATQSLSNGGSVVAEAGSTLEISSNYTVSGNGVIEFTGAGARIVSDGASATFTNASYIDAYASGQIGDGNLTFDNAGTTAVLQPGAVLTINTGNNIVINTGTFEAEGGATLAIASSLSNAGTLKAGEAQASGGSTGRLDLGADGGTESVNDTGAIDVWGGSELAISGNYAVAGTGTLQLKGAGADITSDGNAPATLTNTSTIEAFASGAVQLGDVGILASNDLTFVNMGEVVATSSSATLTINTGAHLINDTGGLLEAVNGGTLVIDSAVNTGLSGTILADAAGTALVNGAVSGSGTLSSGIVDAGVLDLAGGGSFGGVISGNGTVIIGGALTLHAGASLSAADVIETAGLTLASVSVTNATADNFTMTAASGVMITLGSTGTGSFTNDGTMLVNGAGTARITAPLIDAGTIAVTGGMLEVTGKLSGSGSLSVASGATAYLTAGGALTETISGAGVLELGGAYSLAGDVAAGTVLVNAAHSLSGSGTLAGAVVNRGSVASSGGWLTIDGPVSGTGTFAAGAGTLLDLAGGGSFAGVLASTGTGEVFLAGATTLTPGAKLAGHVVDSANLKLAGVAVTNAAGNIFSLQGAETLSSSGAGAFINDGEFVHSFGQTATVSAPFTNAGTVTAQSGTLSFLGSIAGTGTMNLGLAGTIALGLGAANQLVDFQSLGGGLELAHPLDFAGSITGFASHDSIFLENTSFTGFSFNKDLLTVKHGSTTVASLNIIETSNQFTLTAENHGVLITFG